LFLRRTLNKGPKIASAMSAHRTREEIPTSQTIRARPNVIQDVVPWKACRAGNFPERMRS